jgi:hypothetical protein
MKRNQDPINRFISWRRREMKRIKKENYVHQGFTSPRLNKRKRNKCITKDILASLVRILFSLAHQHSKEDQDEKQEEERRRERKRLVQTVHQFLFLIFGSVVWVSQRKRKRDR